MRHRTDQTQLLDRFLLQYINASNLGPQLAPLLAVDTTALPALREIHQQSQYDHSHDGRTLLSTSQQLLEIIDTARTHFNYPQQVEPTYASLHSPHRREYKLETTHPNDGRYQNDQNCNVSNFQHLKLEKNKPKTVQLELKEIIRPEYRKQVDLKVKDKREEGWGKVIGSRSFLSSNSDGEDIPILKNRGKKERKLPDGGSKSPKVQGKKKKIQLGNASSIGRNYQTQTDVSFQIDLSAMGLFHNNQQSDVSLYKGQSVFVNQNKFTPKASRPSGSKDIQQQEPWECDEEELEEELRQINEKLSHRGYHTQRMKTMADTHSNDLFSDCSYQGRSQNPIVRPYEPVRKKQPKETKTVRLSLTPVKSKSPNRPKRQVSKQLENVKTPIRDKSPHQTKQPYKVSYLYEAQRVQISPAKIQCGKWKKPQRGLISLQIQKHRQG